MSHKLPVTTYGRPWWSPCCGERLFLVWRGHTKGGLSWGRIPCLACMRTYAMTVGSVDELAPVRVMPKVQPAEKVLTAWISEAGLADLERER